MPLLDGFQRHIDYLRLSVTDRCNFRCVYCMPAKGVEFVPRQELLTYDEIDRVVRVFVDLGVTKIRISGGEPTVRKDIAELIRRIGKYRLESFAMTTNGYSLAGLAHAFRQAGLQRVNISLDTLRRDRFMEMARFDGFEQVWEGIWKAVETGFSPVKVNMVVMRGINDDELLDFVELTRHAPLHVRFIEYMPSSGDLGNEFSAARIVKCDEMKERISQRFTMRPWESHVRSGPAKMFTVEGFAGRIGFIDPYSDHFCSTCNRVRLTSLGRLKWCLFSEEGLDLKSFLRSGRSDAEMASWIQERIQVDKPEHHPIPVVDMRLANTRFSQVGG